MPALSLDAEPAFACGQYNTDIQLKTLSRRMKVFNMKIIMRRDFMIFQFEKHKIDNANRRCLSN